MKTALATLLFAAACGSTAKTPATPTAPPPTAHATAADDAVVTKVEQLVDFVNAVELHARAERFRARKVGASRRVDGVGGRRRSWSPATVA